LSRPRPSSGAPSPRAGSPAAPGARPGPVQAGPVGAALRAAPGLVVLTGGQTGVDTLAARAGLGAGLTVHLAFPRGMRQEDGPVTGDRLAELSGAVVHELATAEFAERTWACAGLADAVILIDPAGGDGCAETVRAAAQLGRPLLELTRYVGGFASGLSSPGSVVEAAASDFLSENSPRVVLVAGCRGSLLAQSAMTAAVAGLLGPVMSALAGVAGGRPGRAAAGDPSA
jgi:Circularly permutated YpsA SLOG family